MTTSTMPATSTPMASAAPPSWIEPCAISVEKSAVTPSGTPAVTVSTTACLVSSGTSCWGRANTTVPTAVEPSLETRRISDAMSSSAFASVSCGARASSSARPASSSVCLSSSAFCWASSWARCASSSACAACVWALSPTCATVASSSACALSSCARPASSCAWPSASCCWPASSSALPAVSCCSPSLTCRACSARCASVANGSATCTTPSMSATFASSALMACCCSSVRAEPSSVLHTTRPVPPLADGSSRASRSVTSAVGVPGIEMASVSVPPNVRNAPTASARAVAHAPTTSQARRAANMPIR